MGALLRIVRSLLRRTRGRRYRALAAGATVSGTVTWVDSAYAPVRLPAGLYMRQTYGDAAADRVSVDG